MTREGRLVASLSLLTLVTVGGAAGYMMIEGASLGDALFMTVITISTVGFAEVFPLSTAGRILTTVIIILGIGAALYTAATALEIGIERVLARETRRRRRIIKQIGRLHNHVILCGFGRVGRNVWEALDREGIPVVVIEASPETAAAGRDLGALITEGDATRNEALTEAGIDRARALIACIREDSDNLVTVLSAKSRRPDLPVIARATELEAEEKLRLAGADRVVSPQVVGAQRLAALATEPSLDEFVDVFLHGRLVELRIEGIEISSTSPLVGKLLMESAIRQESGAQVLAIETPTGELKLNPSADIRLAEGQTLIVIGTEAQLERLRTFARRG
jgi:voltage-gated potassium channel